MCGNGLGGIVSLFSYRAPHRIVVVLFVAVLVGLGASIWLVERTSAAIGSVCPVPTGEVSGGIKVCADRGDGATYAAGDLITVCVSANIPQIAIYPPPPPPTIRVENVSADGTARPLIEARTTSGQHCATGRIVEPFGQETIRAQAIGADGKPFQEDSITITTAPR